MRPSGHPRFSPWASGVKFLLKRSGSSPIPLSPRGLTLLGSHGDPTRGCQSTYQTVIAGLVPAIHASNGLLASAERRGAAAEWARGTSPRVTRGVVGCARAMAADDV